MSDIEAQEQKKTTTPRSLRSERRYYGRRTTKSWTGSRSRSRSSSLGQQRTENKEHSSSITAKLPEMFTTTQEAIE